MSGKNSFLEIVKKLETKEENQGYIILIRCGAFFVSVGANAIILSEEVGLKTTCMVKGICKIGIPINSLYDYIKILEKLDYSFVIYNYSKDEMIAIVKTKQEAIEKLAKIRNFLKENLDLELNSKTQIFKSRQGVNFCGYKINEYRLKIRDRGNKKLKKKIKHLTKQIKVGKMTSKEAQKYLAGHLGYINIANVKTLKNNIFYND